MPLLYTLVARGTTVLAEYSAAPGNASTVARRILERLPVPSPSPSSPGGSSSGVDAAGEVAEGAGDNRISYTQDPHAFHILRSDGLIFMCMADVPFGRRIPFTFLDDVRLRFLKLFGRAAAQAALAYEMNDDFARVLAQQLVFFSSNPNADAINRMKGKLDEVRAVMVDNIDKVLERGDRLQLLVDKTSSLHEQTFRFRCQAKELKDAMWLQKAKIILVVAAAALLLLYFLLSYFCGGLTLSSCLPSSSPPAPPPST
eukprot:TRINITY_DN3609_c1_g3_i1.p1 TRINITY_DN3609_c1_g3~~TRINITY_DN3609_c1_g3_i1.p1  ORF type:complete len:257 (+),score=76.54 TRINITY_DN3609_c1_g3_i1:207-977(+)